MSKILLKLLTHKLENLHFGELVFRRDTVNTQHKINE